MPISKKNILINQTFEIDSVEDLGYCKKITTTLEGKPFVIIASNEEYQEKWQ